jgi:uncharacterized protein YndB with AHSA1/START domain
MNTEPLEIKAVLQIGKPADIVFEAIVDPLKMSNYFISKSSGRMEAGKTLMWEFPEFEGSYPVRVGKMEKDRYISYEWDSEAGEPLTVEIFLEPKNGNKTLVTVTEKSMPNNAAGIAWLKSNSGGWANFLACLKAWLEFGINLRKGGFDFMRKEGDA